MVTLEEIKENVFEQTIGTNRREYTGRNLCLEDSQEYLKACVSDLKKNTKNFTRMSNTRLL